MENIVEYNKHNVCLFIKDENYRASLMIFCGVN